MKMQKIQIFLELKIKLKIDWINLLNRHFIFMIALLIGLKTT
jgi:hypothetical protein